MTACILARVAKLPDHLQRSPVGSEPIAPEALAAHQRDAVLARVTDVFAKRGYRETTVEDLFAAGKIGGGNFYSLFEGKEDCFLAAFDRTVSRARGEIVAAAAGGGDWESSAYRGLSRALSLFLAEPLPARLVLIEAQSAGGAAIARRDAVIDAAVAWLREGRRRNRGAKLLLAGFEQAAISGLAFYLQQCLLDSRRHSHAELLEESSALVLEPIVGASRFAELRREAAVS